MITIIAWNDAAAALLKKALPDDLVFSLVKSEVERGISQLFHCKDEVHEAYVVTRLDTEPVEWVIVAYAGSGVHKFGPLFKQAADHRKIAMRAHTVSPVVQRLIRPLGFTWNGERVLRRSAAS